MLLLSRKKGERVRIQCPDLSAIWVTMQAGFIELEHGDTKENIWPSKPCKYKILHDTIIILWLPRRTPRHDDAIGIEAAFEYVILREELIGV